MRKPLGGEDGVATLDDFKLGALDEGIVSTGAVSIVSIQRHGENSATVTYRAG
jgi:hypothetical protein